MVIVQDIKMQETQLQWSHATNLDITSDPVLGHILDEILDMFPNEYHDGFVGMDPWETTDTLQSSPLNAALKEKVAIEKLKQLLMQCEYEFKKTGYSSPFTFPRVTSTHSPVVVLYNKDDDQFIKENESVQWFVKQENQTEGSQPQDYPYIINLQSPPIDHTYAKKRSISDEEAYSAIRQLEMVSSSGTISANNSYKRYRTMASLQEKYPPNNCSYGIPTQQKILTTAMDLNKTTNVTSAPQTSGHGSQPSYTSTCATGVRFASNIKQSSIPLSDILDLETTDKSQYNFQQRNINKIEEHQMKSETKLTAPPTSPTVSLPRTFPVCSSPAEMATRSANNDYLSSPPPSYYQATKSGMKLTPQSPSPGQSPTYMNCVNPNLPIIHGRSNMQQTQRHQINQLRVHPRTHYSVSTMPFNEAAAKLNTSLENMDGVLHTKVPKTRLSRNYNGVIRESHSNMAASMGQSNLQSRVANYQQQVVMSTHSFNQQLPYQLDYPQANAQNINWQQTQRNQQNSTFNVRLANMDGVLHTKVPETRLSRNVDVIRKSHSNMAAYIGQSNLQSNVANYQQQVEVLPTEPLDQQLPSQSDYPQTNARNINSQQTQRNQQYAMLNELLTANRTTRSSGGSYYVRKALQQQQSKIIQRPRRVVRRQPQFSPNMQPSYTPFNSVVNECQYLGLQNDAANSTTLISGGLGSPHSYGSDNFISNSKAHTVHQQPIVHPQNSQFGNGDTYSPSMYNFAADDIMHPYQALG